MEKNGMMCLAHGTIALRKLHSLSSSWEPATACAGCSRASKAAVLWCLPQPCPSSSCRETAVPASLFFWREGSSSLASRCLQLQNSWTRGDMPDNLSFFQLYHFASMKNYLFSHLKRGVEDHDCLDRGMSVTQVNVNEVMRPFPLFLSAFSCN